MIKGITFGAFDFLHAGHISMLEEAKQSCDWLIIGLQTDPTIDRPEKNKPTESIFERYVRLKGCKFVDEIIPYDTEEDLLNLLEIIKPDIRIIGEEYRDKHFTGREIPIKIVYNTRKHNYSSTKCRKSMV